MGDMVEIVRGGQRDRVGKMGVWSVAEAERLRRIVYTRCDEDVHTCHRHETFNQCCV